MKVRRQKDWKILCKNTVRKANCIVNEKYYIPDRDSYLKTVNQNKPDFWNRMLLKY